MFALCCVCCSFKVCGFPFFTPCRQASSKGLLGKLCTWRPGSRSNRHSRIYMPLDRRMATKQGSHAHRLVEGIVAACPPLTCKNTGSRPFMVMRWCSNTLTVHLGALLKRSIRTAVVDAQQQLATGSVPRWRCPRRRSWHSGAT